MSDENQLTKEKLREGDTLRAKFFRWKDRVFKDVKTDAVSVVSDAEFAKFGSAFNRAKEDLVRNPSDQAAYDAAVSGVRNIAVAMSRFGIPVRLDEPEE
jgi:hypothetical protein